MPCRKPDPSIPRGTPKNSKEQRTKNKDERTKTKEQRAKSKDKRLKTKEQKMKNVSIAIGMKS